MQIDVETTTRQSLLSSTISEFSGFSLQALSFRCMVIGRNGAIAGLEPPANSVAVTRVSHKFNGGQRAASAELGRQAIDNGGCKPAGSQIWLSFLGFAPFADGAKLCGYGMRPLVSGCGNGDLG
jgi:hypothetical protein